MITPVTYEEITNISDELGQSFFDEAELPGSFKLEAFKHNWQGLIKNNIGAMWKLMVGGKFAGAIGGVFFPDVNSGEMVASEMFWYVHPDYRNTKWSIRLFRTFEQWAKTMGAKRVFMTYLLSSMPESLKRFYEHQGYKPVEVNYMKDL